MICAQGEGYELKEGVFGAVADDDGNNDEKDDCTEDASKSHFIKFVECLVGRRLERLEIVGDDEDTVTYRFVYAKMDAKGKGGDYVVDFEKEVYSESNFEKKAPEEMFDVYYAAMLKALEDGLKKADIADAVQAMRDLKERFRECMEKEEFPTFVVKDFPEPPSLETKRKEQQ